MEKSLNMLESLRPEQQIFEEEKVDFFALKILIWEFFNISEAPYKTYSVDEKSKLFSRYYSELYEKYYSSSKM